MIDKTICVFDFPRGLFTKLTYRFEKNTLLKFYVIFITFLRDV